MTPTHWIHRQASLVIIMKNHYFIVNFRCFQSFLIVADVFVIIVIVFCYVGFNYSLHSYVDNNNNGSECFSFCRLLSTFVIYMYVFL